MSLISKTKFRDSRDSLYTKGLVDAPTIAQGAYGQLYEDSAGSIITITTGGTYYQWVTSTAGDSNLTTLSTSTDDIEIKEGGAGEYLISFSVSFKTSVPTDTIDWAVHYTAKDGSATRLSYVSADAILMPTNAVVGLVGQGLKFLSVGDKVDLRVTATTNATTVTIKHCSNDCSYLC